MQTQVQLDASDNLEWLHIWYKRQCDGCWEHTQGLRLNRFREPNRFCEPNRSREPDMSREPAWPKAAWQLTIELATTRLRVAAPRFFLLQAVTPGAPWLRCSLTQERFTGTCDEESVERLVGVFRGWMGTSPHSVHPPDNLLAFPALEPASGG